MDVKRTDGEGVATFPMNSRQYVSWRLERLQVCVLGSLLELPLNGLEVVRREIRGKTTFLHVQVLSNVLVKEFLRLNFSMQLIRNQFWGTAILVFRVPLNMWVPFTGLKKNKLAAVLS